MAMAIGTIDPHMFEESNSPDQSDTQRRPSPRRSSHTIIMTGFSISPLNAPISSAPSAPSIAR
jgi:hypothetical protein